MMGAILGFDRQQNKHNQNHHKHLNKHSHSQFTPGLPQVTRKIFCQALHLTPAANASHVTRNASYIARHTSHVTRGDIIINILPHQHVEWTDMQHSNQAITNTRNPNTHNNITNTHRTKT